MLDAIALGELLIDFATVDTDRDGYPTLAAHPGGAPGNFLAALHAYGCSGAMLGKLLSFDPNLRLPLWPDADAAKTQILWGLRQADIVKISDDEVRFLWGCGPEEGAARLLADFGVRLAMVTCGPKGCLLQNAGAAVRVAAPRVLPVDTTGAGDIFGGSAVSRLLQLGRAPEALTEDELTAIGRFAATAASLSTQYPGGISAIVPEETVLRCMEG